MDQKAAKRQVWDRRKWTALAVLALVALAAPAQSYLWEVTAVSDRFVTNLRASDLGRDWLKLDWDYQNLGSVTPKFEVQRGEGGNFVSLVPETTARTFTDQTFTWSTPGAPHSYQYRVRVVYDEANSMGLPDPRWAPIPRTSTLARSPPGCPGAPLT